MKFGYIDFISMSDYYHLLHLSNMGKIMLSTSSHSTFVIFDAFNFQVLNWLKANSSMKVHVFDPFTTGSKSNPTTITAVLTETKVLLMKRWKIVLRPTLPADLNCKADSPNSKVKTFILNNTCTLNDILERLNGFETQNVNTVKPVATSFYQMSRTRLTEDQLAKVKAFNEEAIVKEEKEAKPILKHLLENRTTLSIQPVA